MSDRGKATTASDYVRDHGCATIASTTSANAAANAVLRNVRSPEDGGRNDTSGQCRGGAAVFVGGDVQRSSRSSGKFFRKGDEACSHRARLPDGRLVCALRFRLDPTCSLLVRVRLGRNLITLFSTVNTLREKKSRGARAMGAIDRSRMRPVGAARDCRAWAVSLRRKKKNAFFQRFHLRHAAPTRFATRRRDALYECVASRNSARESMRYEIVGRGRISALHKSDCANLRELWMPFRRSRRHRRRIANVVRSPSKTRRRRLDCASEALRTHRVARIAAPDRRCR